ncbi:type I-F CRISPR-associated protein Csy1 [Methyloprofundus sp.]|uniref:type I-F CRISPR-associated protein Csy1 n=1 Tax=Methyloprofundus sp. TaxID=2020875 RepID=UPI003D132430
MLDKAITAFLENKKQDYLKKRVKGNTSEEDKLSFRQEAQEKYAIESWLIDASQRAKQLSLTSHPAKFVHPNAKASSIIADRKKENDGLLRSGNVAVELDVFGNAAALDVEKFLRIELQDKKTVLQHLEENTETIKQQFAIHEASFKEIREGFLKIRHSDLDQTSEKLKQVYFPVDDDYHLLSVLNASGIIYKLKQKTNDLRFSEENKRLRDELKKAKPAQTKGEITEIYGLTAVGYGGTQAQNISTLNAQNGGVSYLLSSMPPQLEKRQTQPPKNDFFENCLWAGLFKSDFEQFHKVLSWRKNNKDIRDKRDDIVLNSITKVKRLVENIRDINTGWSDSETYEGVVRWQKIWLDEKYADIRTDDQQNHDYLTNAQSYFANWFIGNYKQVTKDNKLLGDDDIDHIKSLLEQEQALLK